MSPTESHQLARELALEYIHTNNIFKHEAQDIDARTKEYFELYKKFRISISKYARDYSYESDNVK
ncbi:hypothetical protein AALB39_04555 [Lachnospiraceae bacterium 54-53]